MRCDPDYSAFPCKHKCGLTKREYFAALAMQGFIRAELEANVTANLAVKYADALIAELNKEQEDAQENP